MTWWLMNAWEDRHNWEIIIVFANTGKEVEGTLFFIDECAQEWNLNIVWVEAVPISKKGWEVAAKVVTYETASRNGEPFEAMIAKLGIPSSATPFCSPQLKRQAVLAYAKQIGWTDFYVAIGVRYDEPKRVNRKSKKQKVIYPLVDLNPKTKRDIINWWANQTFDLDIHPDEGNCDNCWKKGFPMHCRNMQRIPQSFDWWESMQTKYGNLKPRQNDAQPPFNFFRGNKNVADIRAMAELPQETLIQMNLFDEINLCGESCEAF